jgi:hypothetical protein
MSTLVTSYNRLATYVAIYLLGCYLKGSEAILASELAASK